MKRIFLIAALICSSLIVLQSCSPKTTSGTPMAKRGDVSGNWTLTDVTFDGIPEIAVKNFLGESSYKCFVNSTWSLTNSGNGSYSLPGSDACAAKTQAIFWSVNNAAGTFQFKKLYEGDKAKNVTEGYVMNLTATDGNTMTIKSPISYSGRTANVVLNFTKATK